MFAFIDFLTFTLIQLNKFIECLLHAGSITSGEKQTWSPPFMKLIFSGVSRKSDNMVNIILNKLCNMLEDDFVLWDKIVSGLE